MSNRNPSYITPTEYLENERFSAARHEYVDGDVFALADRSRRHDIITSNLVMLCRVSLSKTNCKTFFEGMKVSVSELIYYYPDVFVACQAQADDAGFVIESPCFIAEVLSPLTAAIDKREKLIAYKMIESLQEYAIVWETESRVELHRRHNDGWQTFYFARREEKVEFASIGAQTTVANLYRPIKFKQ